MRAPTLPALLAAAALLAGAGPSLAQISGGNASSNFTNQSFQNQNQIRGLQQQQTFENNQTRMQIQRNELFGPQPTGPTVAPRYR
ncbi:hypothetical protein [Methylobacterium organophilum]|uniref:Uncharacterized protein n=1 Tax=Methylobacterium organophilum TaxID=410 RepID=A0ABQ4TCU7_METOR|nr:hypothetical protein [Methylobacterium organophilum]GJE29520.1 hypothetical protein LKMONMHP_4402 [Methylobacterium organophilum]